MFGKVYKHARWLGGGGYQVAGGNAAMQQMKERLEKELTEVRVRFMLGGIHGLRFEV